MEDVERVLSSIKPNARAEVAERKFISSVLERLKKYLGSARVVLAGSFAKGTFLEGDRDIDIFVLFNHDIEKEAFEGILRAAVENAFPGIKEIKGGKPPISTKSPLYQIAYAQHPYVRLFLKDRKIDIVPAYEIGEHGRHFEMKSAVDRTQLHTEYILSRMSQREKDQVRLLKKFLKANRLYGAEIKVQGFSGYLCELLILKYKGFEECLKAASQWKERTFIDLEEKVEEATALTKFTSPLVVIDPVDEHRNVAAVLSQENYNLFIALSRLYLSSKNKTSFFFPKKPSVAALNAFMKHRHLYCISFAASNVVDDILWGQVRRFTSTLESFLKKEGFELLGKYMERCGNDICILIEVLNSELPEKRLVMGPPLYFASDCNRFAAEHSRGLYIKQGRLCAVEKRAARTLQQLMPKIRNLPLPSHLSSIKNAKLYTKAQIVKKCREALEGYIIRTIAR